MLRMDARGFRRTNCSCWLPTAPPFMKIGPRSESGKTSWGLAGLFSEESPMPAAAGAPRYENEFRRSAYPPPRPTVDTGSSPVRRGGSWIPAPHSDAGPRGRARVYPHTYIYTHTPQHPLIPDRSRGRRGGAGRAIFVPIVLIFMINAPVAWTGLSRDRASSNCD